MSGRAFVDTNILVYAHDVSTGAKHEQARSLLEKLWQERTGALSTQILQELYVSLRRKAGRPLTSRQAHDVVADYLRWAVVINTGESILDAIQLEDRYQVSFWDALVIHAARECGADVLYTEDLNDGQLYDSVRVVNPFGAAAR